jgi:hypothetical protein
VTYVLYIMYILNCTAGKQWRHFALLFLIAVQLFCFPKNPAEEV